MGLTPHQDADYRQRIIGIGTLRTLSKSTADQNIYSASSYVRYDAINPWRMRTEGRIPPA